MNTLRRQPYVESTFADALSAGCNIVQPLLGGEWCRVIVARGHAKVLTYNFHSSTDTDTTRSLSDFACNPEACCYLIGDYFGPPRSVQKIVIWDCWSICKVEEEGPRLHETPIWDMSYRDRFSFAKMQVKLIGAPLSIVPNFPIGEAQNVWDNNDEPHWRGVVYRNSMATAKASIRLQRKYPSMPGTLP